MATEVGKSPRPYKQHTYTSKIYRIIPINVTSAIAVACAGTTTYVLRISDETFLNKNLHPWQTHDEVPSDDSAVHDPISPTAITSTSL